MSIIKNWVEGTAIMFAWYITLEAAGYFDYGINLGIAIFIGAIWFFIDGDD